MVLTLDLETLFLKVLNTSRSTQLQVQYVLLKGLANSILTYVPNMIHICPNKKKKKNTELLVFGRVSFYMVVLWNHRGQLKLFIIEGLGYFADSCLIVIKLFMMTRVKLIIKFVIACLYLFQQLQS